MSDYPTPEELLAAHCTLTKMHRACHDEVRDHPERFRDPRGVMDNAWGGWVEAKRQVAIAASWLTEKEGDPYDVVWHRMLEEDY